MSNRYIVLSPVFIVSHLHRFISIEMKFVRFEDSLFEDCHFEDIKSTDTVFENCTIRSTVFYNTGRFSQDTSALRLQAVFWLYSQQQLQPEIAGHALSVCTYSDSIVNMISKVILERISSKSGSLDLVRVKVKVTVTSCLSHSHLCCISKCNYSRYKHLLVLMHKRISIKSG